MSRSAIGPRLRCYARTQNYFHGRYKGHCVHVTREHSGRAFTFLVQGPDGINIADGIADKGMSLREVIVHAITGAGLWIAAKEGGK